MKHRLLLVAGARPNFMKIAPLCWELRNFDQTFEVLLAHTGQHYDFDMSDSFFQDLDLPEPDFYLGVGSGSHAQQTAHIMEAFERVLLQTRPDCVLVVGDVNSTLACALVSAKISYGAGEQKRPLIVHVESGLRSFDKAMPEEINRKLTDSISDILFVSEPSGVENLRNEGFQNFMSADFSDDGSGSSKALTPFPIPMVALVGNVMIDSLYKMLPLVKKRDPFSKLGFSRQPDTPLILVTLHRPSNVDDTHNLEIILSSLAELSGDCQVVFPVHPRTRQKLEALSAVDVSGLHLSQPLGYLDFICMQSRSDLVITDSGGIQEETTALNVPCLTVRENTERPITITKGTNRLVEIDRNIIIKVARDILRSDKRKGSCPEIWDGKASKRIVKILAEALQ